MAALRSPGDLPILLVRVVEEDDLPLVRQVLQAQEYWRLKGLSADVVILNEHPIELPRRDARGSSTALLDDGPWRAWKHRPGGAYLLRGDRMTEAERDAAGQRGARRPERRSRRARATSSTARIPRPTSYPPELVVLAPPSGRRPPPDAATPRCPPLALANGTRRLRGRAGATT